MQKHTHEHDHKENEYSGDEFYTCPMHPEIHQDHPGECPKCGMALEKEVAPLPSESTKYTCPMHPEIVEDSPGNCPNAAWR